MNGKSFLVAIGLVMAVAMGVAGRPERRPERRVKVSSDKSPTWRHPLPGARTRPARALSEERVEALLAKLKADQPEVYRHLLTLRRDRPKAFEEAVRRLDRVHRRMDELPSEMRRLLGAQRKQRVIRFGLVKRYRDATDKQVKAALGAKIRESTAKIFDADQKFKEFKLRQMARELEQLKSELQDRAARRDELIDQRVKSLLAPSPNQAMER